MKNLIHRVLNLLLYIAFCAMVGTGLLMAYRLPPGNRGGRWIDSPRHGSPRMGRRPPLDFLHCHRSSHRPPWHELDVAQEDRRFDETTASPGRITRGNSYYCCVTRTPRHRQ